MGSIRKVRPNRLAERVMGQCLRTLSRSSDFPAPVGGQSCLRLGTRSTERVIGGGCTTLVKCQCGWFPPSCELCRAGGSKRKYRVFTTRTFCLRFWKLFELPMGTLGEFCDVLVKLSRNCRNVGVPKAKKETEVDIPSAFEVLGAASKGGLTQRAKKEGNLPLPDLGFRALVLLQRD